MLVAVTKVSNDDFLDFRNVNSIEDLIRLKKQFQYPLIFRTNFSSYEEIKDLMKWRDLSEEKAKLLKECEYEIEIYDDYIE